MGFEVQLREILHRLPTTRHNLLFSATLPTSLAEFAKAGLNNPSFIRLDTEHRISPDLELAFLSVKPDEKEAALLVLLREVIRIPVTNAATDDSPRAIIFASTKHHVEYLSTLLQAANFRTSYIYGSLDQVARQQQLRHFRDGKSELLVVTDVAARGLDIPAMGHVINYDFPAGVRVFVHRVGRTARAGQKGHAWSLVTRDDQPYLHDLETFLERNIVSDTNAFGTVPRDSLEATSEYIHHSLETSEPQLESLRGVMKRGQAMFERSRSKASRDAYRALKADKEARNRLRTHPAFVSGESADEAGEKRATLLAAIQDYNPHETIFEVGARGGQQATAVVMKQRRQALARSQARKRQQPQTEDGDIEMEDTQEVSCCLHRLATNMEVTTSKPTKSYRDPNFFLPHENVETNRSKG
jgi:ATP-dependent RNA helicase DDX54/DBP10